jgi:membrane-bound lytic murein transglycosylase D
MVTRDVHFDQIANVLGVDVEMLRSLNPAYRRNVVPGNTKPSAIRLIPNDIARFIDLQDSIYSYKTNELLTKRYEVEVDNRQLSSSKRKSKVRGRRNRQGGSQSVTIRKGDTLAAIAKRNGTTVKKLKLLNGLKNNNVRAGKKLKVR